MRKKHRKEKVKKVLCQICGREYFPKGIKSHEAAHRREAEERFRENNGEQLPPVELPIMALCFNLLTKIEDLMKTKLRKVEINDEEWSLKVYLKNSGAQRMEE